MAVKRSNLRNKFDRAVENYSNDFDQVQERTETERQDDFYTGTRQRHRPLKETFRHELEDTIADFRDRVHSLSSQSKEDETINRKCLNRIVERILSRFRKKTEQTSNLNDPTIFKIFNRVSKIDRFARVFYPVSFSLFNIVYWKYYLAQRDVE
jgi:hypothetical protein